MNYARLLLGALAACLIILIGEFAMIAVLGGQISAARDAAGMKPFVAQPVVGLAEVVLTAVFLIWLYAVMRARSGPGLLTAIKAGAAGWFGLILLGTLHTIWEDFGIASSVLLLVAAFSLPVFLIATVAGAWIYREP